MSGPSGVLHRLNDLSLMLIVIYLILRPINRAVKKPILRL